MTTPDDTVAEERLRQERPLLGDTPEEIAQMLPKARQGAATQAADFAQINTYCMFIGYPRSGHSIVGSLLDAHENIIIAHELNALKFIEAGCTWEELSWLLLYNSSQFARYGRHWGNYDYEVPGQWQGRFSQLRVIGDKKGGTSTMLIGKDPALLSRLQQVVPHPIRYIHVTRNPYDNIATIARKDTRGDLRAAIRLYFHLCQVNQEITKQVGQAAVLILRHEDIIADPKAVLRRLAEFLGVPLPEDWQSACAKIVSPRPSHTREQLKWPDAAIKAIQNKITGFDFLQGYSFED